MPSVKTSSTTTESAPSRRLATISPMRPASGVSLAGARAALRGAVRPASSALRVAGHRVELGLVERGVGQLALDGAAVEAPLGDVAVGEDEHQQAAAIRERHELEVAELGAPRARRRDDRRRAGVAGQDARRQAQPVVAGQLHLAELVTDHEPVGRVELGLAHEGLDVQPIPEVRGDAPGAGVRVAEQAQRLELRHGAADGGRRDAEAVAGDERLRSDGDGGEHVVLDDGAQHRTLPLGQVDRRPRDVRLAMHLIRH